MPCEDTSYDIPTQCGRKSGQLNVDGTPNAPACNTAGAEACCSTFEVFRNVRRLVLSLCPPPPLFAR
jgi:hypothetical protein